MQKNLEAKRSLIDNSLLGQANAELSPRVEVAFQSWAKKMRKKFPDTALGDSLFGFSIHLNHSNRNTSLGKVHYPGNTISSREHALLIVRECLVEDPNWDLSVSYIDRLSGADGMWGNQPITLADGTIVLVDYKTGIPVNK